MCEPVTGTTLLYGALIGGGLSGGMAALSGGSTDDIIGGVIMGGVMGAATAGVGQGLGVGASAAGGGTGGTTGGGVGIWSAEQISAAHGGLDALMAGTATGEVVYPVAAASQSALATYGPWAMMGASTLMQVQGQQQAAQSAAAMAQHQSQVAGYNMQVAQQQAAFTRQDADRELLERKRSLTRFTGQQRSLLSASGVELASGSPLNLLADTEAMGQRDIQQAARMGERDVWAAQVGAQQQQMSANKYSMSAQSSASQRSFKMGTTLLSGGGSLLKSFPVTK